MAKKDTGNFVAEWFGHRVYPAVRSDAVALADQSAGRCPFLSAAEGVSKLCTKAAASKGVCTISSASNVLRQDWLVCPNRVVESALLDDVIRTLFSTGAKKTPFHAAAPRLVDKRTRARISRELELGERPIVYLRDKLGGEISLSRTASSPEMSFDITLAELGLVSGHPDVLRYGVLEIQTMDFHGSYRQAVKDLEDALRLHGAKFPEELTKHPEWCSKGVEGPNISNVFKRTFYQLMLKFRLARANRSAGTVVAVPEAVWDSWQRHLASPTLRPVGTRTHEMFAPGIDPDKEGRALIYVFSIDVGSSGTPQPIRIQKRIVTTADSLAHFALHAAPDEALRVGGPAEQIPVAIRSRLRKFWPEFGG